MNFSLRAIMYATALVACALAGFGVGGLILAATALGVWRLAFPGARPMAAWLERLLALYVIVSLGGVLLIAGLWGLKGWSFDPAEYDLAPQVCKWMFLVLAIAPVVLWLQEKPRHRANTTQDDEVELPQDFE